MKVKSRSKLVRDPIHGDIRLGPIQASIIDTPIFQRLRYIKQNGLLHFVFPGAVHTRFAHSIGTSHVARRVFDNLAQDMRDASGASVDSNSIQYIEQVFITAALLHDCGHSAFSHSIEGVKLNGEESIFGSIEALANEWTTDEFDLSQWLEKAKHSGFVVNSDHITHEEIGLLLIAYFNNNKELSEVVLNQLDSSLHMFLQDVQSLIDQRLPFSERFRLSAEKITNEIRKADRISSGDRSVQLRAALSSLISGTLDVDRMDYLLRDSHYTGTTYGLYDFHVLINSIRLGVWDDGEDPELLICLQARACSAFDDFLWSRYQLFNQVLNHKTNVMLNAMLEDALTEIIESSKSRIAKPQDLKDFIAFTDEHIMSDVIVAALNEDKQRFYKRVLVDRDLPIYLGRIEVSDRDSGGPTSSDDQIQLAKLIEKQKSIFAEELKLTEPSEIRTHITKSTFLKNVVLPYVIRHDKVSGEIKVEPFLENDSYQLLRWSAVEASGEDSYNDPMKQEPGTELHDFDVKPSHGIPAIVKHVHFFVDGLALN